jgi:predicted phosphodiesterase
MRTAIFADVHGNLIALEKFLKVTSNAVDAYICLGDVVNYGPWSDECLERIHDLKNVTILEGNHERLFLGVEDIEQELPLVRAFFQHLHKSFSRIDLIRDLPTSRGLCGFHCVHTINGQLIFPDTDINIDRNYFIGHTHHQFRMERSGFLIVNPGSIGQNRKWIDMIDYAVIDTESNEIVFHSVRYDFENFLSELRVRRYSKQCIGYYAHKPRFNT